MMRKPKSTASAVSDFPCSPSAVWRTLTKEKGYQDWFGYPKPEELVFVDPSFSVGAKLVFKGALSSMVITEIRNERELTFSDDAHQISFRLDPIDEGCAVTMVFSVFSEQAFEAADPVRYCAETLRRLKKAAAGTRLSPAGPPAEPISPRPTAGEFIRRVFTGYRRPVTAADVSRIGEVYGSLIEHTEAAVTISRRALLFALLLAVLFFGCIRVSLSFERSEIVPSSGLSLYESAEVNKYLSTLIRIGDRRSELELRLSCQGIRISVDRYPRYLYNSTAKIANGSAAEQIFVDYDAFGNARRIGYVDWTRAGITLQKVPPSGKLREDTEYYDIFDINIHLSPSMNIYEVEEVVGQSLSAYTVDKSGVTVLYFGRFFLGEDEDLFSTDYRSQIMVTLDQSGAVTSVRFHSAIQPNDPFPLNALSDPLKRQYADFEEYLSDRLFYERTALLPGCTGEQIGVLLATEGVPIFQDDEAGLETLSYSLRSPVRDETGYRYRYYVTYEAGLAVGAVFENTKLMTFTGETLGDSATYSFYAGMSADAALRQAGILPSGAVFAGGSVKNLFFGAAAAVDDDMETVYPLTLQFGESGLLTGYRFYSPPASGQEDPAAGT